jgi:hypothetical protein
MQSERIPLKRIATSSLGVEGMKVKYKAYSNGDKYEGQLSEKGKPNGVGRMRYRDGSYYKGGWNEGTKHGKCVELSPDGVVFEGEYNAGEREGYANVDYGDGSHYSGYLMRGEFNSFGIFEWANGKRYEGEWKSGLFHGKGSMKYPNGDKYCGDFVNGLKEGTGTFTWASGPSYKGKWKAGVRNGEGLHTQASGLQFPVFYVKGERVVPQNNLHKYSTFFETEEDKTREFLLRQRRMMTMNNLGKGSQISL